jgi:hypothetical protein
MVGVVTSWERHTFAKSNKKLWEGGFEAEAEIVKLLELIHRGQYGGPCGVFGLGAGRGDCLSYELFAARVVEEFVEDGRAS